MSLAIADLSLVDVAAQIRDRRLSARQVTQVALDRIAALQPQLNCFISLHAEQALQQAASVDARLDAGETLGPLAGVPLAHKDMFYRAGMVKSFGSKIHRDGVTDYTATVLKRLDAAGAIDLGGLNMSEFAMGPIGHNAHFGHCRNPWDPTRAAGGSSSGSGAATAARLIYGALGSDTGGSVRLPAAFCGLVGLKPSQGRVSRYGAMPLSHTLDCVGPLTRSVQDNALLFSLIAGADAQDPTSHDLPHEDFATACDAPIDGLRIGIAKDYFNQDLDQAVEHSLIETAKSLEALGARLVEIALPDHAQLNPLWTLISSTEAAAIHADWLAERPQDYGAQVRRRLEIGLYHPAPMYLRALNARAAALQAFHAQVFDHCDALFTPTAPIPAPDLEATDVGAEGDMPALIQRIGGFCRTINFLGLPALSVPTGLNDAGLPLAAQFIGPVFAEALLYRLGAAVEREVGFAEQMPAIAKLE